MVLCALGRVSLSFISELLTLGEQNLRCIFIKKKKRFVVSNDGDNGVLLWWFSYLD